MGLISHKKMLLYCVLYMMHAFTYAGDAVQNHGPLKERADSLYVQMSWYLEIEYLDSIRIMLDDHRKELKNRSNCYWLAMDAYVKHDYSQTVRYLEQCQPDKLSNYTMLLKSKALSRLGEHQEGQRVLEAQKTEAFTHANSLYRLIYAANLINPTQDVAVTQDRAFIGMLQQLDFKSASYQNYKQYCLGKYFHKQLMTDSALYYYRRVKEFSETNPSNSYLLAQVSQRIGDIFYFKFNQTKSIYYYKKSLTLYQSHFPYLKTELFSIYRNLAFFLTNTNKDQALQYQQHAIELGEKINPEYHIDAIMEMAYLHENHGDIANTERYFLRSEAIANEKLGKHDPVYLDIYNQIFIFYYYGDKNIFKALSYLNLLIQAYERFPEKYNHYHYNVSNGILHLETGDYDLALEHFRTGLAHVNNEKGDKSPYELPAHLTVSRHLTQKQTILTEYLASTFYLKYHKSTQELEDLKMSLDYYNLLADYFETCRNEIPEFYARMSFENLRHDERRAILNNIKVALDLYEKTKHGDYLQEAYEFMERSRDMVLTNTIYSKQLKKQRDVPDSLIEKERILTSQIELMSSNLFEKRSYLKPKIEVDQFERLIQEKERISQEINTYFSSNSQTNTLISINQAQKQLDRNQLLIEYAIHREELYSFAITSDTVVYHRQKKVKEIENDIQLYSKLLRTPPNHSSEGDYKRFVRVSHQLYSVLVEPFEDLMNDKSELIFIPEDILNTIVFETLLVNNNDTTFVDYGSLPYLLNDFSMSYGLSATLYFDKQAKISPRPIYAVAPDYPFKAVSGDIKDSLAQKLTSLPSLKGAVKEMNYLHNEFNATAAGKDLTEESFRKEIQAFNILHLAMHSVIDPDFPEYNALILSPRTTDGSDGILHTYEVMNYDLNNPLVVLSACNTGSGKLMTGEGIFSIAKGFIMAGSSGVLTTFWEQNDASAFELMKLMYRSLYNEPSPARALQNAKKQYLQQADPLKNHPYYWSGYILIGNPQLHHYNTMIIITVVAVVVLAFLLIGFLNKRKK